MARRSTKRAMLPPQMFIPNRGVNYGVAPVDLGGDELARSLNGYYPKQSNRWTVRPGYECVTNAVNKLSTPVLALKPYYNGTTLYLVAASGGKLYQMTKAILEGATPTWTEIGSLTDSTTKPSMVVYNGKLCVADGGTNVRYWDGSTYGTLTNSPAGCTALAEAKGRLIGNSSVSLDYVFLSAPNFTDLDWKSGSGQLEIPAGFGDGVPVNAFAVGPGGQDVLVSKKNDQQGVAQIRRLIMSDATPANWFVSEPTDATTGAQNAHGMLNAFGRSFYFDDVGIRAVAATDTYADVEPDPHFGKRLNKTFETFNAVVNEVSFLPTIGAMIILIKSHPQPYLYFPRNDAFCPWRLSGAVINSACTIDGNIYLAADDGNLYRMNNDIDTDELQPGETPLGIQSFGRTKKVVAGGRDLILKRTTFAMTPIKSGTITVRSILNDEATQKDLDTFDVEDGAELLGLATGLLAEATGLLGAAGAEPTQKTIHQTSPRTPGLQIEWYGNGSRYELEHISAEIAGPLGR